MKPLEPWSRYEQAMIWGGFAALLYFPLFLHLDVNPIKIWDESLFALRAYSLAHYGEYLCNFADLPGGAESANTKPPLISLIQAALFRLMGYSELALRLPIALSAVVLVGAMIGWGRIHPATRSWGLWSGLVLITMPGFVQEHVTRTGDHDAPMALFNFLLLLGAHLYAEEAPNRRRGLWLMAVAWLAGLLTKGTMALLFLPAVGGYLLLRKKLLPMLRDRQTWWALLLVAGVLGLYVWYQSWSCPGYFSRANRFEGLGRLANTLGGHQHPWYFYVGSWWRWKLPYWLPWLIPAAGIPWLPRFRSQAPALALLWGAALSGTLVLSLAQTKLDWYDASILPTLAMLIGFVIWALHRSLLSWLSPRPRWARGLLLLVLLGGLFALPYARIIDKVYLPQERATSGERPAFLLKHYAKHRPAIREIAFFQTYRSDNLQFYQLVYNQHRGYDLRYYQAWTQIQPGDLLIICQPSADEQFRQRFRYQVVELNLGCHAYQVEGYTEQGREEMGLPYPAAP